MVKTMNLLSRFLTLLVTFVLVFALGCTKKDSGEQKPPRLENTADVEVPEPKEKPFVYCAVHESCSDFREYEIKCRTKQNEKDCRAFVSLFEKLAVKNDCKRKFDTGPVPSVWICDEVVEESTFPKLLERSATTLSKLKYPFARKFYGSEAFRSTLDGAVAEDHREKSMKTQD